MASEDSIRGVRPMYIEVDGNALAHNIREIRRRRPHAVNIIAPLKANACGNGVLGVARYLQALDVYAIATGDACEAIALRKAGIGCRILLFPCHLTTGIGTLARYQLIPTVSSLEGASAVSASVTPLARGGTRYPLFVKV